MKKTVLLLLVVLFITIMATPISAQYSNLNCTKVEGRKAARCCVDIDYFIIKNQMCLYADMEAIPYFFINFTIDDVEAISNNISVTDNSTDFLVGCYSKFGIDSTCLTLKNLWHNGSCFYTIPAVAISADLKTLGKFDLFSMDIGKFGLWADYTNKDDLMNHCPEDPNAVLAGGVAALKPSTIYIALFSLVSLFAMLL